jgi:tRNA threonylcarbamoyladenosine biosynthesis protein TsaE
LTLKIHLHSPEATSDIACILAHTLTAGDTLLLYGDGGAGKTHFARQLISDRLRFIGAVEDIPSPTFTLVQIYDLGDVDLWHVDLYRLTATDEIYELGLNTAIDEAICLIEWPERLGVLKPSAALSLRFEILGKGERQLHIAWSAAKWDTLPKLLSQST